MADWRDFDWEELPEWNLGAQIVVWLVGAVATLGLVAWLLLVPKVEALTVAANEEASLKMLYRAKANKVAALPDVETQITALRQQYYQVSRQLPEEEELATLLAGINEIGVKQSLSFEQMEWQPRTRADWIYEIPLEIELTGDYANIGEFSAAVARMPRVVSLQNFKLHKSEKSSLGEQLKFAVSAKTYRFIEQGGQP